MSQKGRKAMKKGGKGEQVRGPSRNDQDNTDGLDSLLSEANKNVEYDIGRVVGYHGGKVVAVQTSRHGSGRAWPHANKRLGIVLRNALKADSNLLEVHSVTTLIGKKGYAFEVVAVNLCSSLDRDKPEKEPCPQVRDLITRRCLGVIPPRPDAQDEEIQFEDDDVLAGVLDEEEVNLDDL